MASTTGRRRAQQSSLHLSIFLFVLLLLFFGAFFLDWTGALLVRGCHKNSPLVIAVEVVKRSKMLTGPAAVSSRLKQNTTQTKKSKQKGQKAFTFPRRSRNLACKSSTDKLLAICERINQHLFWPLSPLFFLLVAALNTSTTDRYADERAFLLDFSMFSFFSDHFFHSFFSLFGNYFFYFYFFRA